MKYLGEEEIREEADEWRRRLLKNSKKQFVRTTWDNIISQDKNGNKKGNQ